MKKELLEMDERLKDVENWSIVNIILSIAIALTTLLNTALILL